MRNLILIILTILTLFSCKTPTKIVEVPVEVIKKEYVYNTKIDSIYISEIVLIDGKKVILYTSLNGILNYNISILKKDMKYVKDIIISMTEPPLLNVAWLQPLE